MFRKSRHTIRFMSWDERKLHRELCVWGCTCDLNQFNFLEQPWEKGQEHKGQRCFARWKVSSTSPLPVCTEKIRMCHLAPRARVLTGLTSWQLWRSFWILYVGCSDLSSVGGCLLPFSLGCGMGQVDAYLWCCFHAKQFNLSIVVWIMLIADCYNFGFCSFWIDRHPVRLTLVSHSGPHGGSSSSGTIAVVLSRAVLEGLQGLKLLKRRRLYISSTERSFDV